MPKLCQLSFWMTLVKSVEVCLNDGIVQWSFVEVDKSHKVFIDLSFLKRKDFFSKYTGYFV